MTSLPKPAPAPFPRPLYSIVVPVYRGAQTIPELLRRVTAVMGELGQTFEIIFVDDGSPDDSWSVIGELAAADERVRGLQLMRNFGQPGAVMCGLSRIRGDFVITLDDDLQHPPEEIPKLIAALGPNVDVVIGVPDEKKHHAARNLASWFTNALSARLVHKGSNIKLTSFRLMRANVVEPLVRENLPSPAPGAQLTTITKRIENVVVEHHPRKAGKSGYTFSKMVNLGISKFLGFSTFPLRFLSVLGLIGVIGSVGFGLFIYAARLAGIIKVPGYTSSTLILTTSAGFNFLAFGIVGEYLHQILVTVRHTQPFIVRNEIGPSEAVEHLPTQPDAR
jgi:glycosyltransferase involved in cell wall biosynthesis